MMKKIKLPPGFKIEVYASGVLAARQMAWGDKGTLFVGSFGLGNVYAITDNGGKKEVKTILKGLNMPTGLAFRDGALYVIAVDKLIKYDNAEANLDKLGDGKVVYDDMPSYAAHGWKYLAADKDGWFYVPFGPPFNIGIPPTSVSQIRRVDPKTGNAEIWWRSASATASAATSIRAPANTGSPKTPATGSATICRATSST